jgi:predicted small secreted protein
MSRPLVAVLLVCSVSLAGCSTVAGIAGIDLSPNPLSVAVPTAILSGDTVLATANVTHKDGHLESVTATWQTSDATVISVDASGRMVGHLEGRSATIFADYQGQTASAVVSVASDDKRLGYALAEQPAAAGPYSPDATYLYNSSGGAVEVTRESAGVYSVRFAGLGRPNGGRDNVQVTGYGTAGAYCKPGGVATNPLPGWSSVGSDLVVPVDCFIGDGTPTDSRFSILMMGARPFGPTTPTAFVLTFADTGTVVLDTTLTSRNSAGGHIYMGRVSDGNYAIQFQGIGSATGAVPFAVQVTAVGGSAKKCRIGAVDQSTDGVNILCVRPVGGGVGDSPFSLLWFTKGRPSLRYAFAWANNSQSTTAYTPVAPFALNSKGGSITSRRTGTGQYQVTFGGLGRPAGATENVQLSPAWEDGNQLICNITSWGNTGANDLSVTVACYDLTGAPANSRFNVLVVE